MKNKFIRVIQPLSLIMQLLLNTAALAILLLTIIKMIKKIDFYLICIIVIGLLLIITFTKTTIELLKNGVIFSDEGFEFTALDSNNKFSYSDIEFAEGYRDAKVSFKKTFTDRYSSVIIHLKDKSVITLELGFTTKKTLNKIVDEINKRAA